MNIYVLLLAALLTTRTASAQLTSSAANGPSASDLGKIALSVVVESNADKLSSSQLSKLESKLLAIAARNGVSGQGYEGNFVLTPKFEVFNVQTVEGMRSLKVVDADLNLLVRQNTTSMVFATYTTKLQGSGTSENEALDNAIQKINPANPELKGFMDEAKRKIIQFYNAKCGQILKESDRVANLGDYDKALAILTAVPVEAEQCYGQIEKQSISIFKRYQKKACNQQLLRAKAYIAGNQFLAGLETLALVDPESSCFAESKGVIAATERKINVEEQRYWGLIRQQMRNQFELNKLYIKAVRDMSVAYYSRRPDVRVTIHNFL